MTNFPEILVKFGHFSSSDISIIKGQITTHWKAEGFHIIKK